MTFVCSSCLSGGTTPLCQLKPQTLASNMDQGIQAIDIKSHICWLQAWQKHDGNPPQASLSNYKLIISSCGKLRKRLEVFRASTKSSAAPDSQGGSSLSSRLRHILRKASGLVLACFRRMSYIFTKKRICKIHQWIFI